ncbi:hypothetical protein [Nocardia noduli]|uniref:hypothetical protein n=1 Tax=Nocardia noduli TaxID=2815722 RepID=UPI001C21E4AE|nr:hypothetical protein [Nocardia noduli]
MKRGFVTEIHVRVYCDACGEVYTDPGVTPEQFEPEDVGACFRSLAAAVTWIADCPNVGWTFDGDRVLCDVCQVIERRDRDLTDLHTKD